MTVLPLVVRAQDPEEGEGGDRMTWQTAGVLSVSGAKWMNNLKQLLAVCVCA